MSMQGDLDRHVTEKFTTLLDDWLISTGELTSPAMPVRLTLPIS